MDPHALLYPYCGTMTYSPDITPSKTEDPLTLLPGMPYGPDIIDTSGLRAVIPALILRIAAMICPDGVQRGALARLWETRKLFASLYQTELYNLRTWLTTAMQADRDWQTQVREDLGGEAALARWEQRYENMKAEEDEAPPVQREHKATGSKRHASAPRTDRYGLFRLAPLSKKRDRVKTGRKTLLSHSRDTWISLSRPGLIPLTPDHLRPAKTDLSEAAPINEPALNRPAPNQPALARAGILDRFERMHDAYCWINYKIMNLDLMIAIPAMRRDPIPI